MKGVYKVLLVFELTTLTILMRYILEITRVQSKVISYLKVSKSTRNVKCEMDLYWHVSVHTCFISFFISKT